MRKRRMGYILLVLLVVTGLAGTYHGSISGKERKAAISYLKETRKLLLNSVKGLSKAQLEYRPGPEKRSIRQCLEHINQVEKSSSSTTLKNLDHPSEPAKRNEITIRDEEIIRNINEPSNSSALPDLVQSIPQAEKNSGADVVAEFKLLREKNINFLKTTSADLRNHFLRFPSMAVVDNYQYLLMIAAHTRKYTEEIESIKCSDDFPLRN